MISQSEIANLKQISFELRKDVIKMLSFSKSGHSAGSLGMADVFAALYFKFLNINPKNPFELNRDRLILSNGHICPILYASLAKKGFFPEEELLTFRQINSRLQGHPHSESLPGVENSSGPLGQGLSFGMGVAYNSEISDYKYHTFILGSDGELNEGQSWEAIMWAGAKKLNRVTLIIDKNNIQISGKTQDVLNLDPLDEKFESFGWYVIEIDGNNMEDICLALSKSKSIISKPVVIIANTIPGFGVDFMEYKFEWHGKPPSENEAEIAIKSLERNFNQNEKK